MGFLMTIINMTLAGSIVILVVMLCRVPLRKVPKVFSYALWGTALFRLLCPVSLPARFSAAVALCARVRRDYGRVHFQ